MPRSLPVILATLVALGGAAEAATLDEILAKNLAARGGEARLRAITSLRRTGKVAFGREGAVQAAWASVQQRPGSVRNETTLQGLTAVEAFDGRVGWRVSPFGGRTEPEQVSGDDARALAHDAELEGPLVGWRAKGHRIELLGTEDVDGTLAIKLRVTRKDGELAYVYLDPDSSLEIRVVEIHKVRGAEQITETDLGSYQEVAGVWLPFAIESGPLGGPHPVRLTIERAEANVAVDAAWFAVPASKAAAAAVIVPGPAPATAAAASAPPAPSERARLDDGAVSGLGARNLGAAAISGRIAAVAARVVDGKTTIYVGAASGGVWRSFDGGTTFRPIFDEQPVQSIGAIAIDPQNPRTVWVGTGEAWTRNSVSVGDGIYRSTDGGDTWTHVGLPESERIVRIVVHPRRSDVVYACVPGKLWNDSADRGLYQTTDGGKTWAKILAGANLSTGCSSVSMDPANPDVLLAGMWDFRRQGWTFRSGGAGPDAASGSGLFRSTDGGKTWAPLAGAKGLPAGPWGRIEVVHAPSDGRVVYALIESKATGLFRSADGGATWEARDRSQMMVWRPFYFARLIVDPTNPDRLFKPDLRLIVSEDGGKSFAPAAGGSHGDWHDAWIDPANPRHMIGGDDGGLWQSYDGGIRWWKAMNLPIAQFYHVAIDDRDPYQVYGGLQDNSSWVGDSSYPGGVSNSRWENLYGGDGFWTVPDPSDPDYVYAESQGGHIGRVHRKTLARRDIQPQPAAHEKLRFNWNTPIHASPTQKNVLYIGAQFLFRTRDHGETWERVSPDLTTNDPDKQKQEQSGGVTVDNSSAEMHTTIYSISESPRAANVIWVGTDDGNVQLSRDGARTWTNVTANVPGLPRASWVSWIEASRFDPATAYATFDRHTSGDLSPWVYRTTDYGKTWTRIVGPDQGVRGYAHVIKEDVVKKDLLFLGTELGLWISIDGGARWARFTGSKFPAVAVRELQVHPRDHDLVIATHGRGLWIIDDLSPLRALTDELIQRPTAFLPGRPIQQRLTAGGGWPEGDASYAGASAPGQAVITYYLRARHVYGPIRLDVLDPSGAVIDTLSPGKRRGINRVEWAMQVRPPTVPRAAQVAFSASRGPRVPAGTYTFRLTRGAEVVETKLAIGVDRRARFTAADGKAQYDALMTAHALFGHMTQVADRIDGARAAVRDRLRGLPPADPLAIKLIALADKLDAAKKEIVATTEGGAITGEERIREQLDNVYGAIGTYDGRPTRYQLDRIEALRRELAEVEQGAAKLLATDGKALDEELRKHQRAPLPGLSAITPATTGGSGGVIDRAAIDCVASRGRACGAAAEVDERD